MCPQTTVHLGYAVRMNAIAIAIGQQMIPGIRISMNAV